MHNPSDHSIYYITKDVMSRLQGLTRYDCARADIGCQSAREIAPRPSRPGRRRAPAGDGRRQLRLDRRPRVMTKAKLKIAMTMMTDRDNAARDVAAQLGNSLSTLYAYVDAQGKPRPRSAELLGKRTRIPAATLKSA
jgi:hypothetical protein